LNIISLEHHYLSPLLCLIPDIKLILETSQLGGITHYHRNYQDDAEFADHLISSHGLGELPAMHFSSTKNPNLTSCIGAGYFEYKTPSGIQYIQVHIPVSEHSSCDALICKEYQLQDLIAHINKQNSLYNNKLNHIAVSKPPLLADNMMDDIIKNTIEFLDTGPQYSKYNIRLTRGLIFQGEPGNGKTFACKYINHLASQRGYSVQNIGQVDIEDAYKDGDLLHLLNSNNILFFDDVDLSFLTRSKFRDNNEDSRVACALLSAFDGVHNFSNGVVRIFTTNQKINDIDPAFLRPGRIDQTFTFDKPNKEMRKDFIQNYWDQEILNNIDINNLVRNTEQTSFAELDEIKSLLVRHFVSTGVWDLKCSLNLFKKRISYT